MNKWIKSVNNKINKVACVATPEPPTMWSVNKKTEKKEWIIAMIHMSNIWINAISSVWLASHCWSVHLSWMTETSILDIRQTFQPVVHIFHAYVPLIPLSVTLALGEGHKVNWKQNLLASWFILMWISLLMWMKCRILPQLIGLLSMKRECDNLCSWIRNDHICKILTKTGKPQRCSWECRSWFVTAHTKFNLHNWYSRERTLNDFVECIWYVGLHS